MRANQIIHLEDTNEYKDKTVKKKLRFFMMVLIGLLIMGNYYCYDGPAYLET